MDAGQRKGSDTARLIWTFVSPILFAVGVIGNIMTLVVLFNRKKKISSSTVFLMFLAVADFLVMTILLPRWWIIYMFGYDIRHYSNACCKLHWFMTYFSGTYSCSILTAVTIERIVCTMKPHKTKYWCTVNTAVIISLAITLTLTLVHGHVLFGLQLYEGIITINRTVDLENYPLEFNLNDTFSGELITDCMDSNILSKNSTGFHGHENVTFTCENAANFIDTINSSMPPITTIQNKMRIKVCWHTNNSYGAFFDDVYQLLTTIFYLMIPGGTFFVGAVLIVWKLRLSKRLRMTVAADLHGDKGTKSAFHGHLKQITVTLMVVNVVFFVTTTPAFVYLIGRPFWVDSKKGMTELQEIVWAVVNMMWYSNHAVNFILYFLSGSRFRQQVKDTFTFSCKKRSVTSRSYTQNEMTTNESGFSSKY